jgi:asparagine synthase (glutamine-hydrolysing)
MCSIAGVTDRKSNQLVDSMLEIMKHRAPDDKGVYDDEIITLGMGRLKIVDLVSSNLCPYIGQDIVLSFNGEIYNFKEIRNELKNLGYRFKTTSDTEVLALAWQRWGIKTFSKLNGMYAFAIYDKKKRKLFLARDIAGEKPLYYIQFNNKLYFASEAKSLIKNLNLKKNKPETYEAFQHCLNETLFKNLFQVPAASFLEYDLRKKKITKIEEYWKLKKRKINLKTSEEELNFLLKKSVQLRSNCDVNYALYYSKGIDSSLISSFHKFKSKIYFNDQLNWKKDFYKNIENIVYHLDFPVGSLSSYPLWKLAEKTKKKNIKVVISGEGADEIFGGYVRYMPIYVTWQLKKSFKSYEPLFDKFYSNYLDGFANITVRNEKTEIMRNKMKPIFEMFDDPISAMGFFDFKYVMPSLLQMGDRMSSAFGLENRCPFLDKDIIEFGFNLPPEIKIKNFNQKNILKNILKKKGLFQPLVKEKKGLTILYNKWFKKNDWDRSNYFDYLNDNWRKIF